MVALEYVGELLKPCTKRWCGRRQSGGGENQRTAMHSVHGRYKELGSSRATVASVWRRPTLYGFTWTAYAIAGAIGPVVMGRAFDLTGSYALLLSLLASAGLVSAFLLAQALVGDCCVSPCFTLLPHLPDLVIRPFRHRRCSWHRG